MTLHVHDQRNIEKGQSTPAGIVIYNDPEQIIFYLDDRDDRKSVTITRDEWGRWRVRIFKKGQGKEVDDILLE